MKKLWLAVSLIAFVSVLIVIALVENAGASREPEYHGKKLTAWLDDLDNYPPSSTQTDAVLAIRQMGTNAVPFLVQMLHVKDSPFKIKFLDLLARQHWVSFHLHYDAQKRIEALNALKILGPDAKAAIPNLASLLLKDEDPVEEALAAIVLSQIGPPAAPALENGLTNSDVVVRCSAAEALGALGEPSSVSNLLVALQDPNTAVRVCVAEALQRFPDQANVIVPVLVGSLDNPDYMVRGNAARTLGSFGTNSRPAIPELLKLAAETNRDISEAATKALYEIDPEAAAKLDGK